MTRVPTHYPSTSNALHLRFSRAPSDGASNVYFASVDRSIPLVPGVLIVGLDGEQIAFIEHTVRDSSVTARRCRYADGRRSVVIEAKEGA